MFYTLINATFFFLKDSVLTVVSRKSSSFYNLSVIFAENYFNANFLRASKCTCHCLSVWMLNIFDGPAGPNRFTVFGYPMGTQIRIKSCKKQNVQLNEKYFANPQNISKLNFAEKKAIH